jgi:hypothetical protein
MLKCQERKDSAKVETRAPCLEFPRRIGKVTIPPAASSRLTISATTIYRGFHHRQLRLAQELLMVPSVFLCIAALKGYPCETEGNRQAL